jgi:hypothetical protein
MTRSLVSIPLLLVATLTLIACTSRPVDPTPVADLAPNVIPAPDLPDAGTDFTSDAAMPDFIYAGSALRSETNIVGDWTVALSETTSYVELQISNPGPKMAAAAMDDVSKNTKVAAFVISRSTNTAQIQTEFEAVMASLATAFPNAYGTTTLRASGIQKTTHDGFEGIQSTIVDMASSSPTDASSLRNQVIKSLLGKSAPNLVVGMPHAFANKGWEFVLQLTIVRRFAKDAPNDPNAWRLVIMGSIGLKEHCQDASRTTAIVADDLSNGTPLTVSGAQMSAAAEVLIVNNKPAADIIWVADESGSMDDNREDIVNHANAFFTRALLSGLDFRMGVTNVTAPDGSHAFAVGKFCSRHSTDITDSGGDDRFLLSSEQSLFSACIRNPPGYEGGSEFGLLNAQEAVLKHLPRSANDSSKIRPDAKLVVIIVTDEIPQSLQSKITWQYLDPKACTLPTPIDDEVQPYLDLFKGTTVQGAEAVVHVIGGVCNNSCNADVAHGYRELASGLGGQLADVCQPDLGNTLQTIIDSIVGTASPLVLTGSAISFSVSVTVNGKTVPRSRTEGFDYRAHSNSLAFLNYAYNIGDTVLVNYLRWE